MIVHEQATRNNNNIKKDTLQYGTVTISRRDVLQLRATCYERAISDWLEIQFVICTSEVNAPVSECIDPAVPQQQQTTTYLRLENNFAGDFAVHTATPITLYEY